MSDLVETYTQILDTVIQLDNLEHEVGGLRNKVIQLEAKKRKFRAKILELVESEAP